MIKQKILYMHLTTISQLTLTIT